MEYVKPKVTDYGTLAQLTAGTSSGDCTDAVFPAKTPKGDLTFSTC